MRLKSTEVLRAHFKHAGLSMSELAGSAGCSKSFVSHLIAGRKFSCTAKLAIGIARSLSVPVEALFVADVSTSGERSGQPKRTAA